MEDGGSFSILDPPSSHLFRTSVRWAETLRAETHRSNHVAGITELSSSTSVRQHSHILAAAMLEDDAFAGLLVDLVALAAGFRDIFRRGLVAVAQ